MEALSPALLQVVAGSASAALIVMTWLFLKFVSKEMGEQRLLLSNHLSQVVIAQQNVVIALQVIVDKLEDHRADSRDSMTWARESVQHLNDKVDANTIRIIKLER